MTEAAPGRHLNRAERKAIKRARQGQAVSNLKLKEDAPVQRARYLLPKVPNVETLQRRLKTPINTDVLNIPDNEDRARHIRLHLGRGTDPKQSGELGAPHLRPAFLDYLQSVLNRLGVKPIDDDQSGVWRALDELEKSDPQVARMFRLVTMQAHSVRRAARKCGLNYSEGRELHKRGLDFCAGYVTAYRAARAGES